MKIGNFHDVVDWFVKNGDALEEVFARLNNIETVVLPFLGAAGAPIAAGITVAEDLVEGVTDLATKVDAMFGPGTAAKLQQTASAPAAPAAKPAPAPTKPAPANTSAAAIIAGVASKLAAAV